MTTRLDTLVDRLMSLLANEPSGLEAVRETAMFGGRAVMVNEKMLVSAQRDGTLLVRVPPERFDELIERPGASEATMGKRSMSPGWLIVAAETIDSEDGLRYWFDVAMEYNRAVTASR